MYQIIYNDSVFKMYVTDTKEKVESEIDEEEVTTKLFDNMDMSFVELGAYLGFNRINKFLEVSVIKASFKKQCALTLLNEQNFNKFVFTTLKENVHDLFEYLKGYKFFNIKSLSINKEGIQIYQIL